MTDYEYLSKRVKEYLIIKRVLHLYNEIKKNNVVDLSPTRLLEYTILAHVNGWLYTNSDMKTIVCAYRTNDCEVDKVEEVEDGKILFVYFAISKSEDKMALKKMLTEYLKQNKGITEIFFEYKDKDQKRRYKINEVENGKEKRTECAIT